MSSSPKNILVVRNDKLGDFMLAWPTLSMLKQHYPDANITVLIPEYTRPIAELCPWIDGIIIDDQKVSVLSDAKHLANIIKPHQYDVSITLFSQLRVAIALWLAGIPVRVAPATKLAQVFYNRKLVQRRSRSEKPEFEYNVDLARYFIRLNDDHLQELQPPPYLSFSNEILDLTRQDFVNGFNIDKDKKLVFVHPGSGGSANNLSTEQFAELVKNLSENNQLHFIITAGPDELDGAIALSKQIDGVTHNIYHSTKGLVNFTQHIAVCDLFISGSTGPLHIAGALNCKTAAFYPTRRSATFLRWQTLNEENRRLAFSPKVVSQNADLSTIDPVDCAKTIQKKLL